MPCHNFDEAGDDDSDFCLLPFPLQLYQGKRFHFSNSFGRIFVCCLSVSKALYDCPSCGIDHFGLLFSYSLAIRDQVSWASAKENWIARISWTGHASKVNFSTM